MLKTPAAFAACARLWLGSIVPEICATPELPAPAPGQLIMSAQNGRLMLFATGYPVAIDEESGAETFGSAEIWIADDAEGDLSPVLALVPVQS